MKKKTTKQQKFYKVCRVINGQAYSAYNLGETFSRPTKHTPLYSIGQKTVPRIGKIFAFEDRLCASDFACGVSWIVFEGIGQMAKRQACYHLSSSDIRTQEKFLRDFWKNPKSRKLDPVTMPNPPSTVLLDWFIPKMVVFPPCKTSSASHA